MLVDAARSSGISGYVGDGTQCWPAVHGLDDGRLFRLVLEQGAPARWPHAVADEGEVRRFIAEVIGHQLNLPAEAVPAESSGSLADVFGVDQPASSAVTREKVSWQPTHVSPLGSRSWELSSLRQPRDELACSCGSTRDRVELPGPRHPLQRVLTSVSELNARANHKVLDGTRDKNLAG